MASETIKIKIDLGTYKFDAEGPKNDVQAEADKFYKAVKSLGDHQSGARENAPPTDPAPRSHDDAKSPAKSSGANKHAKIFECKDEILILKIQPKAGPDKMSESALAILLGYKECLNNEAVIVHKLLQSTKKSGLTGFEKIIYVMDPLLEEGLVFKNGIKRGTRYTLTASGIAKAEKVISSLIAHISDVKSS